jgi:hypothetical protein
MDFAALNSETFVCTRLSAENFGSSFFEVATRCWFRKKNREMEQQPGGVVVEVAHAAVSRFLVFWRDCSPLHGMMSACSTLRMNEQS